MLIYFVLIVTIAKGIYLSLACLLRVSTIRSIVDSRVKNDENTEDIIWVSNDDKSLSRKKSRKWAYGQLMETDVSLLKARIGQL